MTGEVYIKDWSGDNVGAAAFVQGQVVVVDTANSTNGKTAVALPAGANAQPIGVAMEPAKKDNTGAVVAGSAVQVRTWGLAWCNVATSGTVNAGDVVAVGDTSGNVATVSRTAGGTQPNPIVGRALTGVSSAPAGSQVLVLLMIGATY